MMLTVGVLLAGDKGSRQTRAPFEVVPAGDSTAATHVRQKEGREKEPGSWANCVEGALLRRFGGEVIHCNQEGAWNLAKEERRSRKRTRK